MPATGLRADATRLQSLVTAAHAKGLWIRFYTLNGHAESDVARLDSELQFRFAFAGPLAMAGSG